MWITNDYAKLRQTRRWITYLEKHEIRHHKNNHKRTLLRVQ